VLELREKLGPLLWQLPPESKFSPDHLELFLSLLPQSVSAAIELATQSATSDHSANDLPDRPLRHAIEVRDASYLNTEFIAIAKAHNVAVVFTNGPGTPGLRDLTSDFVYIRLNSGEDHYADGYDDATLQEWAERIDGWLQGRDVYAYFKNPAGVLPHTPHNAVRLIHALAAPTQPPV
jgi:uncharacterized protein YecE (DUF72 family)